MWNLNPASHCTTSAISRNFEQSSECEGSLSPAVAAQSCTKVAQRPVSNRFARLVGRICMADDRSGSCVYFVEAEGLRRLKIGFSSTFPTKRIASLQTSCPAELRTVAVVWGSRKLEKSLHRYFKAEHCHGEWFRLSRRLRQFLEAIQVRNLLVTGERFMTYPIRCTQRDYCRTVERDHRLESMTTFGDYRWLFAVRAGFRRGFNIPGITDEQVIRMQISEAQ